ncbi:hypothetical protein BD289DRAFT_445298 [Coniella lustricola]|uniref:Uncharacterized protein n=1 Tax=Coniella lustricola TaxID=2025994 RepID=A0A2T2ZV30_9PEZI|nr:hypothetical protein BD289DRAFT_445298 [Coniella lustricola]
MPSTRTAQSLSMPIANVEQSQSHMMDCHKEPRAQSFSRSVNSRSRWPFQYIVTNLCAVPLFTGSVCRQLRASR